MAIGIVTTANAARLYSAGKVADRKADVKSSAFSPREEKVELSGLKRKDEPSELEKIIQAQPEIRIPLVEELQERIRTGNYPIDRRLDDIADRLIGSGDNFKSVA